MQKALTTYIINDRIATSFIFKIKKLVNKRIIVDEQKDGCTDIEIWILYLQKMIQLPEIHSRKSKTEKNFGLTQDRNTRGLCDCRCYSYIYDVNLL